ncbi:MAG: PEGA domain-containing protein [Acidobacteria bacterium]|nr:PEGA domain-containing protein [Acidobacteriota bacterium]
MSVHRGFYYHPYFGFYYGPYYGPFYPYPGPFAGQARYAVSALRTRVKPVDTEVYVNGYYAGLVDDFDGVFQRLYLPAGEHEVTFRLDGYETWRERLYLQPGDTRDVVHVMRRLRAGEAAAPLAAPRAVPESWTTPSAESGDRPASPFGILTLRVTPADAHVVIDGEVWLDLDGRSELVVHVPAGAHQLEVRREGYQAFKTGIELSEGAATKLDVTLQAR